MTDAYRLSDPEFSETSSDMLNGEGAFLHGGRWNSKGVHVVYMSSNLSLASLELLVHLGAPDVLMTYNQIRITFDDDLVEHIDLADLPSDWREPAMESSVQALGDDWVRAGSSLVLQVPSVVSPGEFNYLLNPKHPDWGSLDVGNITPFDYDPRLLKT